MKNEEKREEEYFPLIPSLIVKDIEYDILGAE